MNSAMIFAQPLQGEFSREGHVLRADSHLLTMHLAAGGEDDGLLAIPGLLTLLRQTARLKMGLARSVLVANGSEYQELWAETRFEGSVVYLSILSSRQVEISEESEARLYDVDRLDGFFDLEIDDTGRLLLFGGNFPNDFDFRFVGKSWLECVRLDGKAQQEWEAARVGERAFSADNVSLVDIAGHYKIDGRPSFGADGRLTGYHIEVQPASEALLSAAADTLLSDVDEGGSNRFFGMKLAPALRQPLGRIIANAETIGEKLKGPLRDNYAVYAKDISDAAKHLVSLVDDLGDLEAVERNDFKTAKEDVDLGDAARRISGLLALKAADHHIEIILPDGEDQVIANAEFRRVLQILLNLVNNAIRYSPDGTRIRIDIAELNDIACITVSDEGEGVPAEDREIIFEKFERLGRSGDGGSGLGLYISRRLARAMDGDLTIGDTSSGGACFALTLPAATK